jgi:hypothetical protein
MKNISLNGIGPLAQLPLSVLLLLVDQQVPVPTTKMQMNLFVWSNHHIIDILSLLPSCCRSLFSLPIHQQKAKESKQPRK